MRSSQPEAQARALAAPELPLANWWAVPPPVNAMAPQAPSGVHKHIAPLPQGTAYGAADIRGLSFYVNQPDSVWNHGEGTALPFDSACTVSTTGPA